MERSTHMHATIGGMWTMMAGWPWGVVVHGGGWWCVEDGGGSVCGQSSQACFHAESIEMDNLTLARRSSTYEACAHVPPGRWGGPARDLLPNTSVPFS